MHILYPFPMHLSNGYSYMLSILQFLNALAKFHTVEILSLDSREEIEFFFQDTLNIKMSNSLIITQVSNKFIFLKSNKLFFFKNLSKIIKSFDQDKDLIIYTRDFKQMRLCLKSFKNRKNMKFVFEVHQILSENYRKRGDQKNSKKMYNLESYVFKNIDFLVAITTTLRDEIIRKFDTRINTDLILPVGFNQDFIKEYNLKKDIDIIYTGNFSEWKGLDILIEAIKIVKNKFKRDISTYIIGARNTEIDKFNKLVKEKNLQENIKILERIKHKEIIKFLRRAHIGALPNKYLDDGAMYTSPLKLYEYLGIGLKVVASRLPSIQSEIEESLVYFFTPENPVDLADKIEFALNDKKFSQKKVKDFARLYTWEARALKFSNFFNENTSN